MIDSLFSRDKTFLFSLAHLANLPVFTDWPVKFITEDGTGKRAKRNSAAMHSIRSQARKHALLERRQRHAASHGSYKHGYRTVQTTSGRADIHSSMQIPDATSSAHTCCVCAEGANPSNQEDDPRNSGQMAQLLVEIQDVQAEYRPVIRANPRKPHEASRNHALQRQALQRISPQTNLGGGRADPFESYPIKGEPYDHILIDHCKSLRFVLLRLGKFPEREAANLL
jgi:hypothetical protein